jgi:hypothetical protein
VKGDPGILPDATELNLQTAGGRAKLGEVSVELSDPAAQVRLFFGKNDLGPGFGGLNGCRQTAHTSSDNQNFVVVGAHLSPPLGAYRSGFRSSAFGFQAKKEGFKTPPPGRPKRKRSIHLSAVIRDRKPKTENRGKKVAVVRFQAHGPK